MSYSRWSRSIWYCYRTQGENDEAMFQACGVGTWSYSEIKNNRSKVLDSVRKHENEVSPVDDTIGQVFKDFTDTEISELNGYMDQFCLDVEAEPKNS